MYKYFDKCKFLNKEIFSNSDNNDDYLKQYFCKNNYLKYITNYENINEKQEKALDILFNEELDLLDRCQKAIDINNTCFEAFYVLDYISDSLSFYYDTLDIQNTPIDNYENEYEINDVVNIKMIISMYYMGICNYHQGLKYLEEIEKYIDYDSMLTHKLLIFNYLEDFKSINEIYMSSSFSKPEHYIIFIVCLLKNDQRNLAKDIYEDMLDRYKYASYICKPQELSLIKDEESNEMMKAIESCFDLIESVPFFFSWASDCVDDKNAPIN